MNEHRLHCKRSTVALKSNIIQMFYNWDSTGGFKKEFFCFGFYLEATMELIVEAKVVGQKRPIFTDWRIELPPLDKNRGIT